MPRRVTLSDQAYRSLLHLQRRGETVSDVVTRITSTRVLASFAGTMDEATARHYHRVIAERRRRERAGRRIPRKTR